MTTFCNVPSPVEKFEQTRDIVDSRNLWKKVACVCAAKDARLIQWSTKAKIPDFPACKK